jgi:photosynthetic reaction center H subunit
MPTGAITQDIDAAQLLFATFAVFFGGLVLYLRREDKREGYPLEDPAGRRQIIGFPEPPGPKTFNLMDGGTTTAPHDENPEIISARPSHRFPGAALRPLGNPLLSAVGPAAYAMRKDEPLIYLPGKIQVLPMRVLEDWHVVKGDADPRGMPVFGADGKEAGSVSDLWIDRSVKILRYLEVELTAAADPRRVLLPIYYAQVEKRRRRVRVSALRAGQFADVPALRDADTVTAREEDQINAYYAGGIFYNRTLRQETSA